MTISRNGTSWFTRLAHRVGDTWTVVTFGIPMLSHSTSLRVGRETLQLHQWSGSQVGSGGFLWGASRRLARYIEAHGDGCPERGSAPAVASRPLPGLKLLELGSGTGGMGLAAAILGAHVTLTDQASHIYPGEAQPTAPTAERTLLDLAKVNVQQNAAVLPLPLPTVAKLWWGDLADLAALPHPTYDIVVGSDVLLFTRSHQGLLLTLQQLSSSSTVVLLEHTDRGNLSDEFPRDLQHFLDLVIEEGLWAPTIVYDCGRHITLRMVYA